MNAPETAPDNRVPPRLSEALLADAPRMNFFRLCELIELAAPDHPPLGTTDSPANEPVRFRSNGRLGFPGREIDAVERDPDHPGAPPVVRTNFLGLYGVDARMPSYFVDEVAQRRDGAEPLAAFLDLFHHRIVTQFYRVARKYRYPLGFRRDGGDEVSRYLLSLLGLGLGGSAVSNTVPTQKLLSMLGLASQRTRTAEGLAGVLQHAVPDAGVRVDEFHPVWTRLPAGADERRPLGQNCVLGRGFFDRANAVRVVITPRTADLVQGLMPGHAQHREVMALLRFYLGHTAHACIEMHVRTSLMPAPALNDGAVRLGYSTQLPAPEEAVTRVQLGIWNGIVQPAARPERHSSSHH